MLSTLWDIILIRFEAGQSVANGFAQCFKVLKCICSDSSTSFSATLLSPGMQTPSWGESALFWNTFPVSAIPCPFNLLREVQAGTLGVSEQAVHQRAHTALLCCHALCRHFLASSSCFSLKLLEIAKEHASVFAYIESLDDIDLCYLSLPGPTDEQRCFFLLSEVLASACCSPFLMVNGERVSVGVHVCEQALQTPSQTPLWQPLLWNFY